MGIRREERRKEIREKREGIINIKRVGEKGRQLLLIPRGKKARAEKTENLLPVIPPQLAVGI